MKRTVLEKGMTLLLLGVLCCLTAACNREDATQEDYRDAVFKENTRFQIEENDNRYLMSLSGNGERIYGVFSETVYSEINEFEGGALDGTFEDDMVVEPMGTPALAEPEPITETESQTDELTADEAESETSDESLFYEDDFYEDDFYEEYDNFNYQTIIHVVTYDLAGTILNETAITLGDGEYVNVVQVEPATGDIILSVIRNDTEFFLRKYDSEGVEVASAQLESESEYMYISRALVTRDGKIVISLDQEILVFESDLSASKSVKGDSYIYSLEQTSAGEVFIVSEKAEGNGEYMQIARVLDTATGEFVEEYVLPETIFNATIMSGQGGYDMLIAETGGVFGYHLGENTSEKIMGYVESDISIGNSDPVIMLDEDTLAIPFRNPNTWRMESVVIYDKAVAEEIPEKDIILLGLLNYDIEVANRVIEFNKNSQTARIQIKAYQEGKKDWETARKEFNNDLITGNCPDIVCFMNAPDDMYLYMEKGAFTPLDSFIEKDPEIDAEDIFPNVKSVLSADGKLYGITPSFYVMTAVMKSQYAPESGRITFDELASLEEQLGAQAFYEFNREGILMNMMSMGYDDYINVRTGKCNFDSAFVDSLEFMANYPETIEYDDNMDYSMYQTLYRDDKAILQYMYLSDFRNFNYTEKGTFGEEVSFVGFPGAESKGAIINCEWVYTISNKSKVKDEAWQFIRYVLTDEVQKEIDYSFPSKMSICEELMFEQMKKPYIVYEDGTTSEYEESYWMGDQEITFAPISEERARYVFDYIKSVDAMEYGNQQIIDIIKEETAPFFAGQKTAEQATEIIQSRVQTYINESR